METDKPRTRPKTPPTKKKTRASKLRFDVKVVLNRELFRHFQNFMDF